MSKRNNDSNNNISWNEPIGALYYDFRKLVSSYPELNKNFIRNGQYNFTNHQALVDLTTTILKEYHGIEVQLSSKNLCPRVPNRYIYLEWIRRVLHFTAENGHQQQDQAVIGVDIGTGSNAIYALLGASKNQNWYMIGTECDPSSVDLAKHNIELNQNLKSRIEILNTDPTGLMLDFEKFKKAIYATQKKDNTGKQPPTTWFTMSNPPFFDYSEKQTTSHLQKIKNTMLVASDSELFYPGGEVGFVTRQIDESLALAPNGKPVKWFTSMIGRFASLRSIVEHLRAKGITNYGIFEINPAFQKNNRSTSSYDDSNDLLQSNYVEEIQENIIIEENNDINNLNRDKSNTNNRNEKNLGNAELPNSYQKSTKPIVRWIIAWSLQHYHLPDFLGHKYSAKYKGLNGLLTTSKIDVSQYVKNKVSFNVVELLKRDVLNKLHYIKLEASAISLYVSESRTVTTKIITLEVAGDVWSRAYRRKLKKIEHQQQAQQQQKSTKQELNEKDDTETVPAKKRKIETGESGDSKSGDSKSSANNASVDTCHERDDRSVFQLVYNEPRGEVIVFWKFGAKEKIFESFCGFIKRQIDENAK